MLSAWSYSSAIYLPREYECLLSTYYAPGFVPGTNNTAVNKTEQRPCPYKAYTLEEDIDHKQMYTMSVV